MLLAKRTKPPLKWSFPGGGIEAGESAEAAAIREAREEVSVEIEILGKAGVREITLPERRYVISVFAAGLLSGEPMVGPEASEIGWFEVAEIAALDATDELVRFAVEAKRAFLAAKT